MNRFRFTASICWLLLCQACQQQPAPPPATNKLDAPAMAQPPVHDTVDEDAKQPFEYDIDTLYHGQAPNPSTGYYGEFEGDEPYWSIKFQGKKLQWYSPEGDQLKESVAFSTEANRGFHVAFKSAHLFGVVVRSAADTCMCAVYEPDYLPMDITISAKGETYVGCGILKGVDLRRG